MAIRSPESSSVRRWLGQSTPGVYPRSGSRSARGRRSPPPPGRGRGRARRGRRGRRRRGRHGAGRGRRRRAPAAAAAGADAGQLLGGLAGDLRVLGEAQADAAALAVDLDHADGDLVALVEHLLDRRDPLAGRDVGDVQQAVGALGELDERAERRRLDDLARELVADLDLLGHRADAVDQGVALGAGRRVDEDLALVVDVDLRLELLRTGRGSSRRPCRSAGRSCPGRS